MKIAFVMVLYTEIKDFPWTRICVNSFREHFPYETLIAVDHNENPQEKTFCEKHNVMVLKSNKEKFHSNGIKIALDKIKEKFDAMILIEPDCLIMGKEWYKEISKALEKGFWMAGSSKLEWGPIHPCPTGWLLEKIPFSFDYTEQAMDLYHPKYRGLMNVDSICKRVLNAKNEFQKKNEIAKLLYWDVGLKNWFHSAIQNKAFHTKGNDFKHFWYGRNRSPEDWLKNNNNQFEKQFEKYLDSGIQKIFI